MRWISVILSLFVLGLAIETAAAQAGDKIFIDPEGSGDNEDDHDDDDDSQEFGSGVTTVAYPASSSGPPGPVVTSGLVTSGHASTGLEAPSETPSDENEQTTATHEHEHASSPPQQAGDTSAQAETTQVAHAPIPSAAASPGATQEGGAASTGSSGSSTSGARAGGMGRMNSATDAPTMVMEDAIQPRSVIPVHEEMPGTARAAVDDSPFEKTEVLAAVIAGGAVGVVMAALLVAFLVHRIRKKDTGSYALDPNKPAQTNGDYQIAPTQEIYA